MSSEDKYFKNESIMYNILINFSILSINELRETVLLIIFDARKIICDAHFKVCIITDLSKSPYLYASVKIEYYFSDKYLFKLLNPAFSDFFSPRK